jgi:Kef-type K+ transport system membrane component KefB
MKVSISKNTLFYVFTITFFSALIYWIAKEGISLEDGREVIKSEKALNPFQDFVESISHNLAHPLAILLAQIVSIILVARFFGWLFSKIGQPSVVGEIIAGIVLGPSLLGLYFPEFSKALFPIESLSNLNILSQMGLIMFMYVIGMELDLKVLKNKASDAVVISHASIIIPFALGMVLSYFLYDVFAPKGVEFLSFALFMGIAMSITAFPVLARIVQERGIHKTRLGAIVITCAAADDITAWCLLAAVIAIVKAGSFVSSLYVIAMAVGYVFIMLKVVRPFLRRIGDLHNSPEHLSKSVVAIFFVTLLLSSYATEVIGIHALFGAFMTGAIMPENTRFRSLFIEKIEDVSIVLLLPLFFVFTGLRTEIGLLDDIQLWKVTGAIVMVAVVGKFIGSMIAAKVVGQNWRDSLMIGALMNTRGLMELVVLNIGYDLGVLSPEIFAMMVIMALATTIMTGPALDVIGWLFRNKKDVDHDSALAQERRYKILISFANPETGRSLLKLANSLIKKSNGQATCTVMHLTPASQVHSYNIEQHEHDSFAPIIQESKHLNQEIVTLFKIASDIEGDIAEVANKGEYDLLLIGLGKSIYEGSLLGKILGFTTRIINPENLLQTVTRRKWIFDSNVFDERTQLILSRTRIPTGIFIDKDFTKIQRILIPVYTSQDLFLIVYAKKMIQHADAKVDILEVNRQILTDTSVVSTIGDLDKELAPSLTILPNAIINKELLAQYDLLLINQLAWEILVNEKTTWLTNIPSTLIIDNKA